MAHTIKQFLNTLTTEINMGGALQLSPIPLNSRLLPKPIIDRKYSIEYQSTNTNKYRDRTHERILQEVSLNYVVIIKPGKQYDALVDAADIENGLKVLMMDQTRFPEYYVRYKSTNRQVSTGGDYHFTTITFDIEHDWSIE